MAFIEFKPLDEKSLIEYIKTVPSLYSKLGSNLKVKGVGDGNLNFVYIVVSHVGSFVIKQALPYMRCIVESWPMTKEQAYFEAVALRGLELNTPCWQNTCQNSWRGHFISHPSFIVPPRSTNVQLLSFVGTWSYAGLLSRLFFLTLRRFLGITIGLPLILIVMLRLFERIMFSSLKLLS